MSDFIQPVILCGGGGTRLWPRSRAHKPKPFLPLLGERTLFQQTIDRVTEPHLFASPLVVAGEAHVSLAREQGGANLALVAEPVGRNTAPAIALAAHRMSAETVMLVCPSDHYIHDVAAFVAAARAGAVLARDGHLVSLGITPDRPETGYGYIKRGEPLGQGFRIDQFVEKPDLATAERFLADGSYSWNGGIFLFTAGRFIEELARHRPNMAEQVAEAVRNGSETDLVFRPDRGAFEAIDGDSIDYAVMEPTGSAAMIPVAMGWSDIGNWQALSDARGGASHGPCDLIEADNVFVDSDGPRVSVVGLDNIIVVVDGDEVLITSSKDAQKVGELPGAQVR
ncbi:MAG: mannose-1-phosphate guanylyltransferase [Erythrobacter sp.]|nr:mannose-1-phosphate guanylyltransferase [Erythrobacter sp.]